MSVLVKGHLAGTGSLLQPSGCYRSNSDNQGWQQVSVFSDNLDSPKQILGLSLNIQAMNTFIFNWLVSIFCSISLMKNKIYFCSAWEKSVSLLGKK